ncbi:uncharacterized protein LOC119101404 [Pollicipes pollicipes]|uniref:uncharacterized protein LOC119101404 n=1 Tax=Pollicipes pollicipes TaxID=41117 RepID=UPI0018855BE7|nr:uncharacterized protein LOC119101404 [Pollicipes pollicipes]
MFGSLKQKLQSLSPLASPVASPNSSPRPRRRLPFGRGPARRRQRRQEYREVQSDPECDYGSTRRPPRQHGDSARGLFLDDFYDGVTGKAVRNGGAEPGSGHPATAGRASGQSQVSYVDMEGT